MATTANNYRQGPGFWDFVVYIAAIITLFLFVVMIDKNEWSYTEPGGNDSFSLREMEMMFCYGMLNQQDVTVDKLDEQLKTAQDKIDRIIEMIKTMRNEPKI